MQSSRPEWGVKEGNKNDNKIQAKQHAEQMQNKKRKGEQNKRFG
jgi:hypothetical protein